MRKTYSLLIGVLVILGILVFYVNARNPIRVALIGNFEDERNNFDANSIIAARIAEANINSDFGILGRKTELVIRHTDFTNPEEDAKFLVQKKVEAVITTATSTELNKLRPFLNKYKISTISVISTSLEDNTDENDYVYKLLPDDHVEIGALLKYLDSQNIEKRFSIIADDANRAYMESVERVISDNGGQVVYKELFSVNPMGYVLKDVQRLEESGVIIMLAAPKDAAFMLQNIRRENVKTPVCGLSWSGDNNLLQYGGRASEGFILVSPIDFNSNSGNYYKLTKELKEKYEKQNGLLPVLIYDSYSIISKAYADKLSNHKTLKAALNSYASHRKIDDISGEFIYVVKSGQFEKVEEIK